MPGVSLPGTVTNVQYPQRSRQSLVSGMNTLREYVITAGLPAATSPASRVLAA